MKTTVLAVLAASALTLAPAAGSAQSDLAEVPSPGAHADQAAAFRSDTVNLTLAPAKDIRRGDQIEYMVHMKGDETLVYSLTATGAQDLWHEFHGHTGEKVTFYKKASGASHQGVLKAPFEGEHGWYLENRSDKPVTVQLKLSGFYRVLAGE